MHPFLLRAGVVLSVSLFALWGIYLYVLPIGLVDSVFGRRFDELPPSIVCEGPTIDSVSGKRYRKCLWRTAFHEVEFRSYDERDVEVPSGLTGEFTDRIRTVNALVGTFVLVLFVATGWVFLILVMRLARRATETKR